MKNMGNSNTQLSISVIIPVRNVENMIESVLHQIAQGLSGSKVKIFILDNCSTDQTQKKIHDAIVQIQDTQNLEFEYVLNSENLGYGGSLKKGFQLAKEFSSEWIMVAHGDDQADWHSITRLMVDTLVSSNDDLIITSRFMAHSNIRNYSRQRKLGNYAFRFITNNLFKTKMSDPGAAILMIKKEALNLEWITPLREDYLFHPGLNIIFYKSQLRIKEIPMNWRDASHPGEIKLIKYGINLIAFLMRVFFRKTIFRENWVRSVAK